MSDAMRVLVVDDEQVVLDSVRKHLKRENYEITTALSAGEAIEVLDGPGADIVITDLMMPGMDGLELLERVRQRGENLPVVMITGYATMRTALQALRKGAFDYIAKPFTRAELQGVVARAARQSAAGGAADLGAPARDAAGPESYLHLGAHCWVQVEEGGVARVGLERGFLDTVGEVEHIELPGAGDVVEQGSVCLRVLGTDGKTHNVWCPVSGTVLATNTGLAEDPGLAAADPFGAGWAICLETSNLEEELRGLA